MLTRQLSIHLNTPAIFTLDIKNVHAYVQSCEHSAKLNSILTADVLGLAIPHC